MCKFKSGIITKSKVFLAPIYNESHSDLLRSLQIEDNSMNASKMFVRAELVPYNDDKKSPISKWKFVVDQDIVPDWFSNDPGRYEAEFRETVQDWMNEHFEVICGEMCIKVEEDEKKVVYMTADSIFSSKFGTDNNYATSVVREKLQTCEFAEKLKAEYGDKLVPISTDLLSYDGFDDYGVVEGDILSLRTFDQNRKWRKKISNANNWEWLSTPHSTPTGCSSDNVGYVNSYGNVDYFWYGDVRGVRPFFSLYL